jgi:hypothetical protein
LLRREIDNEKEKKWMMDGNLRRQTLKKILYKLLKAQILK